MHVFVCAEADWQVGKWGYGQGAEMVGGLGSRLGSFNFFFFFLVFDIANMCFFFVRRVYEEKIGE
jgi:hypothetical protein